MLPRSISHKISGLRLWERALQLVWGVARWAAQVLAALLVAAAVDWLIDRNQDTPWTLRRLLLLAQVFLAAAALGYFVVWPLLRRLSDSELALWVEDKHPHLEHRLITAIQLNQPGANTAGMSRELVTVVTSEAAERAERIAFTQVADNRRLGWSFAVLVPLAIIAALPFLLIPETANALLARQMLQDVEIPRSIYIDNLTREVWPSGEKVSLRFRVHGKIDEAAARQLVGDVTVRPDNLPRDHYSMQFVKWQKDGAEFVTALPPSSNDFTFWARLEDGRMREPQRVRFVPRPVIAEQHAALVLPSYVGTRSDGKPFEKDQPRGDITGIPGSFARVEIRTQRPVKFARIELLTPKLGGDSAKDIFDETVLRSIDMNIAGDGTRAEGTFPLQEEALAYRIVVTDEHGFANVPPPRRLLRIVPEDPPQVFLLREQFPPAGRLIDEGPAEDYVVDGVPAVINGPIRIAYACEAPYGIGEVRLLYRVLKKAESGNEPVQQEDFQFLKMKRYTPAADVGPFDANRGVFLKTGLFDQVEFYDEPRLLFSNPADEDPARKGGGRYDLKTKGLIDAQGQLVKLKEGDQIEYCIRVFAGTAGDSRPSAQSETRVTNVVGFEEFARWIRDTIQEEQRLRSLEAGQRNVFEERK